MAKGGNSSSSSVRHSYPLKIVLGVEETVPSSCSSPNTFKDSVATIAMVTPVSDSFSIPENDSCILRIRTARGHGHACTVCIEKNEHPRGEEGERARSRATRRNDACRAGHVTRYGGDCSCLRELRAALRENLGETLNPPTTKTISSNRSTEC